MADGSVGSTLGTGPGGSTGPERAVEAGDERGQGATTATCWQEIRAEFLARMQTRVPRALIERGLVGEVTVRLSIDADGHARHVEFENLKGSPRVVDALRAILEPPFAHGCIGEGRWPAKFLQRRV